MAKITNTKVKNWYNTKHNSIKIRQKPFERIKSDIADSSRTFFATYHQIDQEKIIDQQLEKAEEHEGKTKKSRKKKIFNICFFFFNIALVALVLINFANEQGGVQPLSTLFANHPKWRYLFIALGLYFATVFFNTLKFSILIKHKTGKFRLWFSFKLATIGRYYDHVTPLGSGGQPFEIYYLKKNGFSGDEATAIPLAKYMVWQIAFSLLCLVILVFYAQNFTSSTVVLVCAWIGLSITLLLFLFVFMMSITKRFGATLVVGVLKLLHKMHIIKDYKKTLTKVLKFVKSYQFCIKSFAKHPITVLGELIVTMCSEICNAVIAYFIYRAFVAIPVITWWDVVCACCICELAVSFVPLPGGSGAQEISFNSLIGSWFPAGTLFWGVLFWRILTYYLYIVQGLFVLVIDLFHSKRKSQAPPEQQSIAENKQ